MELNLKTFRRLATLYDLIQKHDFIRLQNCFYAARELEKSIIAQEGHIRLSQRDVLHAMVVSDSEGRAFGVMEHDAAVRRGISMKAALKQNEIQSETARQRYLASKLKYDQIARLLEAADKEAMVRLARKEQTNTDERFLQRQSREGKPFRSTEYSA